MCENIYDGFGGKLKQVDSFKYPGSVLNERSGCDQDVKARVKLA